MNALFEIASAMKTPLALAGIVVVALYLIFKAILKLNIFPKLTRRDTFQLINKIMTYLFILAFIAIVLGFVSHMGGNREDNKVPEDALIPVPTTDQGNTTTLNMDDTPEEEESALEGISVIHCVQTMEYPRITFNITLMNNTDETQVITRLEVDVMEYLVPMGPIETGIIQPIIVWSFELPSREGIFSYLPPRPIRIASHDQALIIFSVSRPRGDEMYTLKFIFVSASGLKAKTSYISL